MNDLISRQAAISVADGADYTGLAVEDVKKVTDEVVKGLKKLPSAQSEQRWIPCSERLPENERSVLVTTLNGDVTDAKYWHKERIWVKGLAIMSVTAWMPLPEPYKEEH